MPRQIMMEFDLGPNEPFLLHRVLNFNEAPFALARDDKWMSFPLDQVDKANGQRIDVRSARSLSRVMAKVEELIERHRLTQIARLTVVAPPT
jgi:hypothetical protein